MEEKKRLNDSLVFETIAKSTDNSLQETKILEINNRLADIEGELLSLNLEDQEETEILNKKMNFGGYSPLDKNKTTAKMTDEENIDKSKAETLTVDSATNVAYTNPLLSTMNPNLGKERSSNSEEKETEEERLKRLELERRERDKFFDAIRSNQNVSFQEMSSIQHEDYSLIPPNVRKRKNNDEITFQVERKNEDLNARFINPSSGVIPKHSNKSKINPTLGRIDKEDNEKAMPYNEQRFSTYVATPKRVLSSTKIPNKTLRSTFYPQEDEPIDQNYTIMDHEYYKIRCFAQKLSWRRFR